MLISRPNLFNTGLTGLSLTRLPRGIFGSGPLGTVIPGGPERNRVSDAGELVLRSSEAAGLLIRRTTAEAGSLVRRTTENAQTLTRREVAAAGNLSRETSVPAGNLNVGELL